MIIISQDKLRHVYTENIVCLEYTGGEIIANGTDDNWYDLGTYTEERAEEVLNDIVNTRAVFEIYKCSDANRQSVVDKRMLKEDFIFDIYEMPEE